MPFKSEVIFRLVYGEKIMRIIGWAFLMLEALIEKITSKLNVVANHHK